MPWTSKLVNNAPLGNWNLIPVMGC